MNRRKEIVKVRTEVNEIESGKTVQENHESKSWFFEKINKIDKHLTRLIKKIRGKTHINKIRNNH